MLLVAVHLVVVHVLPPWYLKMLQCLNNLNIYFYKQLYGVHLKQDFVVCDYFASTKIS